MDRIEFVPAEPATPAASEALNSVHRTSAFEPNEYDYGILTKLERAAEACGFKDEQYLVQATRAMAIPSSFDASQPVTYRDFHDTMFEGIFRGYSKVMIGRIIGAGSVRAFCLNFEDVTIMPTWERPPEDRLFCVPALAINTIHHTS